MITLVLLLNWSPLEVQEIPLYYDVHDFWDFFHVYVFLQILQSYYVFCIYNFILHISFGISSIMSVNI